MLTDLTAAVQEAISKNLSAEIGNHLRSRLNKAEDDAKALTIALADIAEIKKRVQTEMRQDERERTLGAAEKKLAEEQDKLKEAQRELKHTLEIAKIRQDFAELRTSDLKDVVETVFRAPMTKEIMVNSKSTPILKDGYQYGTAVETTTDTKITESGIDPKKQQ